MSVIRVDKRNQYTVIDQATVRDDRLSFKALGLHAYLLSFPDDWEFNTSHLSKNRKEGRDAIKSALAELVAFGYAERVTLRNEDGTLAGTTYVIHETPRDGKGVSRSVNRETENPVLSRSVKKGAKSNKNNETTERRVNRQSDNPQLPITEEEPNSNTEPNKEGSKSESHKFSTWDLKAAEACEQRLIATGNLDDELSETERHKWADEFRKLRELDNKSEDTISLVMRWLFEVDDFWIPKGNFCTAMKLRSKDKNGTKYFKRFELAAVAAVQQNGRDNRNGRGRHGSVEEEIAKAMAP